MIVSEQKYLIMRDGVELHSEFSERGGPIWIIATHGIGEHLGRHSYLKELFGHEFNIFQYDLRGHGRSRGERAYIDDFSVFTKDLDEIIYFLKKKYRMKRYILFGHSMGSLITANYMQNTCNSKFYPEKVILSAPPVGFPGALGNIVKFAPFKLIDKLASIPYSANISGLVDLNALSHDPRVAENYKKDELCSMKYHSKLLLELAKTSLDVFSRPLRIKCTATCIYGTGDKVVSPEAIEHYFTHIDKSFKVKKIVNAKHEIHNEISKYRTKYFDFLKEIFFEDFYNDNE